MGIAASRAAKAASAVGAINCSDKALVLGGWRGPASDVLGPLWTLVKTGLVAVVVIWLRVSWPRLREDQLTRLAWGVLVPVALAQLALTTVVVVARG